MAGRTGWSWSSCALARFALLALLAQACAADVGDGRGREAGDVALPPSGAAGSSALPSTTPPSATPSDASTAPSVPGDPLDTDVTAAILPCDVATVVANRCQQCHGQSLIGGAPMPLVSHADFTKDHVVKTTKGAIGQTMKTYQLVQQRVNDVAAPMPPGSRMADPELSVLNAWLMAGAPAGTTADASCQGAVVQPPDPVEQEPNLDPNETCYELRMHGGQGVGDTSPYTIQTGEYYQCFYYAAPWTEASEGTRFGNVFEHEAVLHHWLLYTTSTVAPGTSVDCVGTHIGDTAQLLAGWAVGGLDVEMPPDVGFEVPAPGTNLLVEWHLYNSTGAAVPDTSGMQVCVVPKGTRPKTGGMTWLGTENFNGPLGMPAGMQSDFSGTCVPSREGMNATDPIHIFAFLPHMHKLGRNMRSVINRANGTQEQVFDMPFDFNHQIHYEVSVDLYPGDTITSTCTFFNDTAAAVPFGNSSDTEMCYQFAMASPASALKNGVFGLNGASNNCW